MDTVKLPLPKKSRPVAVFVRRAALPVLSGVLFALAFPPLGWWWLAWIGLIPGYLSLREWQIVPLTRRNIGWIFGAGYLLGLSLFLVGMIWMSDSDLGLFPYLIVSGIEAIPFGLLAVAFVLLMRPLPVFTRPVLFAALWALFEGLRSIGRYAFPWFFLSSTQVRVLPLLQIVSITAQWGLSFAIALVGALLAEAFFEYRKARWQEALRYVSAAALIPAALAIFGVAAIHQVERDEANLPTRMVGAIQANLDLHSASGIEATQAYTNLTRAAVAQRQSQRLAFVAWPEEEMRQFFVDPQVHTIVTGLARETQTPLIVGTWEEEATQYHNSAAWVDQNGIERGRYDKHRLVPGGEFVPFRDILKPIYGSYNAPRKDFAEGTTPGVFRVGALSPNTQTPTGMLICYEDVFPYLARERVLEGAEVFALLTSDATFGTTAGPVQHADQAIVRSVETRRYALRAAATGTSEIITATGRVRNMVPLGTKGICIGQVVLHRERTLAARGGDWFLGLCAVVVFAAGIFALHALRAPFAPVKDIGDQSSLHNRGQ